MQPKYSLQKPLRSGLLILLIGAWVTTTSCAPRELYVNGVDSFGKASADLSKIVNDQLKEFRAQRRLHLFRHSLVMHIQGDADAISKYLGTSETGVPVSRVLCDPRVDSAKIRAKQSYLQTVSGAFSSVSAAPSDSLVDLTKALGHDYSISISSEQTTSDYLSSCTNDLKDFPKTMYPLTPEPIQKEAGLLAAATALYDTFNEVVAPVLKKGLQEIDSARRASALREFLKEEKNRQAISSAIKSADHLIKEIETVHRHTKSKTYSDAMNKFLEKDWPTELAKLTTCSSLSTNDKDIQSQKFQACFRDAWVKWEKDVEVIITAATEYDETADRAADRSASNLLAASKNLQDIAEGKSTKATVVALFETAVRLQSLANEASKTVESEATRKKIAETLDNFRKALGSKSL